jgi:hypothetical protein
MALYLLTKESSPRYSYFLSCAALACALGWFGMVIYTENPMLWGFGLAWLLVSLLYLQKAAYLEALQYLNKKTNNGVDSTPGSWEKSNASHAERFGIRI